ncbi:MAG TPA: hypothetical protein VFS60_13450 [Thermoanaerobaculia bacterium]|nr:hypothetical protein [Thermoanaerobaculia bacterium]
METSEGFVEVGGGPRLHFRTLGAASALVGVVLYALHHDKRVGRLVQVGAAADLRHRPG